MEDFSALKRSDEPFFLPAHDGIVHHPEGGASYICRKEFIKCILRQLGLVPPNARFPSESESESTAEASSSKTSNPRPDLPAFDSGISLGPDGSSTTVYIHVGAQPNNSPHTGTITVFAAAFVFARALQTTYRTLRERALAAGMDMSGWVDAVRAVVQLDIVDTAPDSSQTSTIDGIVYQRSHRSTGAMDSFLPDYHALLSALSAFVDGEIEYRVTYQDALMRMPAMRDALRAIILDRERIEAELAPEKERLAMRSACPVEGCALADKHGIRNEYAVDAESTTVTFRCPEHGAHSVRLENPDARARLELNTPLRNLARTLVYMADSVASRIPGQRVPQRIHTRVTGGDYQGTYQEQFLYRQLVFLNDEMRLPLKDVWPVFTYVPLIVDWSGAKLSKSYYVRKNAYAYLKPRGMEYLLEYRRMVEQGKDVRVLFRMVEDWFNEPKKLNSRVYSLEYVNLMFTAAEERRRTVMGELKALGRKEYVRLAVALVLGYVVGKTSCVA
ncbi:hypothetical protein L227DRAFT_578041 [Lentinus tigrinus ALCF2SS1-6]|uniref:Uncharacterized protein n=2 Tax=Lentinus tigrinus TaxID=5365 RepID=A0A5C2S1Y7_9APHY|nr:hypothetical protein L227DRAFT_578041 [Lentinus tigrinus ALCF2SS1-6]